MSQKSKRTGREQGVRGEKGHFAPGNTVGEERRFRPGESGNPSGRRGSVVDALRRKLTEAGDGKDAATNAELIADKLIALAMAGEVPAIRELLDRTEGRARQQVDLDVNLLDWRQLAEAHGLDPREVFAEARRLIETSDSSDDD